MMDRRACRRRSDGRTAATEPMVVRPFAAPRRAPLGRLRRALSRGDVLSSHRLARASSRTCSAIALTTCIAERAGAIVGVLPLAELRSRLFGHSLVSLAVLRSTAAPPPTIATPTMR